MNATDTMSHEESWLLLPWLANGRLAPAERARLEQHLRGCDSCAREAAVQRLICRALTEPERVTYAPAPSLRKLLERIDGSGAPRSDSARAPAGRTPRPGNAWRPPGLAWAASFVLAVGVVALGGTAYRWSQPRYATQTETVRPRADVLHVAFERSLTIGEVEALLRSAGARVVEGPDASGVFGVAPVAQAATPAAAAQRLGALGERLRADARVRWIEPRADAVPAAQRGPGPPAREP
ncbi:MAG TPA: anti-sigma factor [Steroidobacteraceae bacterium]|nr:anti-sigma factor [Steroidobacteraceae bacterium]